MNCEDHPVATLKYYDEDEDLITVASLLPERMYLICADAAVQLGSSRELTEKLEEPFPPSSSGLSADLQHGVQFLEHHVFEIDDRDYVRKLWQDIQKSSRESEHVPVAQDQGHAMTWSAEKKNSLAVFYER